MAAYGVYGMFYSKAVLRDGAVAGYEGGIKSMGFARKVTFEPNKPDDNPLYANNTIVENDTSAAAGGTLKIGTDRIPIEAAADLFGTRVEDVSVEVGGETVTGRSIKYRGTEQSAPVGVGCVVSLKEQGVVRHEAVFFRHAVVSMPGMDVSTKEKNITWQTPEMDATVYGLEGDGSEPWHEEAVFPTQAAAVAYIEGLLSKEAPAQTQGGAG